MFSKLKNHPFAVEAFFDYSVVLTFALLKEQLIEKIPECLELDTFNDKWAFLAVAIVKTQDLRPKGFPKILGNDFMLVGYRAFVRYTTNAGKRLRGLYILKSETNKKVMELLGNVFTHYRYTTTDIKQQQNPLLTISSERSRFSMQLNTESEDVALPIASPFANWKEARRFAGPLPFTFSYDSQNKDVSIIEGVRDNWVPKPIEVVQYDISYFDTIGIKNSVLANAFIINDIPYYWKKGRIEKWMR